MRADIRKQYLALAGEPVLFHTLRAFEACTAIGAISLVAPPDELEWVAAHMIAPLGLRTPVTLCPGGRERQDSVRLGLATVAAGHLLVAVHDGVRPLIKPIQIEACLTAAARHGAALLAVPVSDTLKLAGDDRKVRSTLPRDGVWLAQTPQAFERRLIVEAHQSAYADGITGTDDAALVERLGQPVHLVNGSRRNLKVTTPEDLLLAEAFLRTSEARPESA
jgi:2-C-methyl-D-erythritol 4-phosphate cytidylyltransferase